MQLITPTSPPSAMQMAAIYRSIYVLKRFWKPGETLRTCSDLPPTISRNFGFRVFGHIFGESDSIFRFQLKCSWLPQLRRHRQCRWRWSIAQFMFWGVFGSPKGRYGLVLTFPRSFIATLVFEFSGTFLIILELSQFLSSLFMATRVAKKFQTLSKCIFYRNKKVTAYSEMFLGIFQ